MYFRFALILFMVSSLFSCRKDKNTSSQTLQLLQHQWALLLEESVFPDKQDLNTTYTGTSTDYWLFKSNDTLITHQMMPGLNRVVIDTLNYTMRSDNTFIYGPSANTLITINKITEDTLILTNPITATYTDGTTSHVYQGTRTIVFDR